MQPTPLNGLNVLVVEDESIVAFLIEDMLLELGCSGVWYAANINDAYAVLEERRPDAAVLDVNLSEELVYPVAERLQNSRIPFIFATGYARDTIPERWTTQPAIQKPFSGDVLASALVSAIGKHALN